MLENKQTQDSYFSFKLSSVTFSLPVKYVREVFEFEKITPIPNSLDYLKGVMNVRGNVVSIADFRMLFGFECSDDLKGTQIIIMEIPRAGGEKPFPLGIIADSVDVVSPLNLISAESKAYGITEDKAKFVSAVARRDDEFILVLNPEKILEFIESDVSRAVDLLALGRQV